MKHSSQRVLQIISLIVLAIVAVPLTYIALNLISSPSKFLEYILDRKTLLLAWNTIILALTVTIASMCISVPLAIITIRSNLPLRKIIRVF